MYIFFFCTCRATMKNNRYLPYSHLEISSRAFMRHRSFECRVYPVNEKAYLHRPDIRQTVTSGCCNVLYVARPRGEYRILRSIEGAPTRQPPPAPSPSERAVTLSRLKGGKVLAINFRGVSVYTPAHYPPLRVAPLAQPSFPPPLSRRNYK